MITYLGVDFEHFKFIELGMFEFPSITFAYIQYEQIYSSAIKLYSCLFAYQSTTDVSVGRALNTNRVDLF